ncbi:MAG: hypothetical protein CUN57_01955 [Phototrophicales bacterium]|nr:MAG: hypothetical protein CUN57_01955 [Phototrophicales bacterium]
MIENRLKVYNRQTEPLLRFYEARGVLKHINGIGAIDDIFEKLCREIDSVRNNN